MEETLPANTGNSIQVRPNTNAAGIAMPPAAIELHIRPQPGLVEELSVPWHLSANNQLSQMVGETAQLPDAVSVDRFKPIRIGESLALVANGIETARPEFFALEGSSTLPASLIANAPSQDADDPRAPGAGRRFSLPVTMWVSRLVRWLESQDQGREIWIRDFSLDGSAATALANATQSQLRQQGIRLDRVVINAHEVWRAPNQKLLEENT